MQTGRGFRNGLRQDSHSQAETGQPRENAEVARAAAAIVAEGLTKSYGKLRAVDGMDLEIPRGSVFGLLGPNGAGKTSTVRMLTTLLTPDGGRATVMGFDVVRQATDVRRVLGLSGQYAAVDDNLTGRENLEMMGAWITSVVSLPEHGRTS